MGRSGCLLILILIVVILIAGYNQYRIEDMRTKVSAIASKFHVSDKGGKAAPTAGQSDMVTALAQAERHTTQAKELIRKGKTKQAQVELDYALKNLKAANGVSKDIVGDAATFMGKARENAVTVFQKAWKDMSKEAQPKKQ